MKRGKAVISTASPWPFRAGLAALLIAGLLLGAALSGCASERGTALRFGLRSAPITLDPRFATDAASTRINRLLYRRLVDFDERYRPVPDLATWTRPEPRRYLFTLVDGIARFGDGTTLTASDVVATYRSVLDPDVGSPHRGTLANVVDSVRAIDDRTVEFVLSKPDPMFPGYLVIGIAPEEAIAAGAPLNRAPVGNGAFSIVEWAEEGLLTIERVRDRLRVQFVLVRDPNVRVLKLLHGEIDMLQGDLLPELVAWLDTRADVEVVKRDGTNFAYIGFNMEDAVVGDATVRRAVAHAIDRDAIIRYVLGDAARPASAILPADHWAGHPDLPRVGFDPELSKRLLAEAGYGPRNPARIVYKTSSDPLRIRLATIFQDQLERVGIEVDLRSYDWGTFYGDVKAGRFQMYSLAWVGIKLPDIFRYTMHSEAIPPDGANRGRLRSDRADRLIESAEAAEEIEVQARDFRALQEHLLELLPYVPLWFEDQVFVSRLGLRGYRVARDGNYDGLIHVEADGA